MASNYFRVAFAIMLLAGSAGGEAEAQAGHAELPALPAPPVLSPEEIAGFPTCRDEWKTLTGKTAKAASILACIKSLDAYQRSTLTVFWNALATHRKAVREAWDKVNGSAAYDYKQKLTFHGAVTAELGKSGTSGAHAIVYRRLQDKYATERDYLKNMYCSLVVCKT